MKYWRLHAALYFGHASRNLKLIYYPTWFPSVLDTWWILLFDLFYFHFFLLYLGVILKSWLFSECYFEVVPHTVGTKTGRRWHTIPMEAYKFVLAQYVLYYASPCQTRSLTNIYNLDFFNFCFLMIWHSKKSKSAVFESREAKFWTELKPRSNGFTLCRTLYCFGVPEHFYQSQPKSSKREGRYHCNNKFVTEINLPAVVCWTLEF